MKTFHNTVKAAWNHCNSQGGMYAFVQLILTTSPNFYTYYDAKTGEFTN